jgi:hypothetical protein
MGSRPKDPNEVFAQRAKGAVDRAMKAQKKTTKELRNLSDDRLGKKAPQNYFQIAREIGGSSGTTFSDYVKGVRKEFGDVTNRLTEQGRRDLRTFDPDLIGSKSVDETSRYLIALGDRFSNDVERLGKSGRDRLFALPEQARIAFTASSLSPASENLRNQSYMSLVQDPNTTQTNILTTGKPFMTYNV